MKTNRDTQGHIRYLYYQEGWNITRIACQLGMARKTVRRVLRGEKAGKRAQKNSKLEPFTEEITRILSNKPQLSTTLVLEELRHKGYQGGKTILYDYLRRIHANRQQAYLNLQTHPGEQGQVDWASCGTIKCGEYSRRLYCFCLVLSYSRYLYLKFTVSMDMDTFLGAHIAAFRHLGGAPCTMLYDNLKSVVLNRSGREIHFNPRFLDFACFYGFRALACNVRQAQEKGKVERIIHYIKNNFLARGPYQNLDHLTAAASQWMRTTANGRVHSTTRKIPQEVFMNEEKALLIALPPADYDYPTPRQVHVSKDALLQCDSNRYSVPYQCAGQSLTLKAFLNELKIYHVNELVASHPRCYDKYRLIKNPAHYEGLVRKKEQARSQYVAGVFSGLCPEAEEYLKALAAHQTNVGFQVKKIMELESLWGKTAVCAAVARALEHGAFHWEYIKNIVLQNRPSIQKLILGPTLQTEIMDIDVQPPDLALYDELPIKGPAADGQKEPNEPE